MWLVISCVGSILLLALIVYLMRDQIKNYAVNYINSYLKSELHVKDIDVTFITTFPKATVCFINPFILDPDSLAIPKDTLFSANKVYFEFDVWDIFYGVYDIESIRAEKPYTRLYIDKNGKENYDIAKAQTDSIKKPDEFKLNLKSIKADNFRFKYKNDFLDQEYKLLASNPILTGKFNGDNLAFTYKSKILVNKIRKEKINLVRNQSGELNVKVKIDRAKNKIYFPTGNLNLGKMKLSMKGNVLTANDETKINLNIVGKKVPIVSVLSLLPENVRKKADDYESRGLVDALLTVKGNVGKKQTPLINAEFKIDKGSIIAKKSGISLHTLDLIGTYTNFNKDGKDEIYLKKFDARMKDGSFSMKYRMKDFTTPRIDVSLESDLRLETIYDFIRPDYVSSMNGSVKTSWKLACTISNPDDITTRNIEVHNASGHFIFTDASVKLTDMYQSFTGLNGKFTVNKTDALIEDVSGKTGSTDFQINGAIQNLTTYILTGNSVMNIVGSIHSNNTDLNDLIKQDENLAEEKAKTNKKPYQFSFPTIINLNVDVAIAKLAWNKFKAEEVSGNVLMLQDRLDIRNLKTTTAGGKVDGKINIADIGNNTFKITSTSHFEEVKMDEILILFNEFGQKQITSQNIKGNLTADMQMAAEMDRSLTIDRKKLLAHVNVHITGGELNNLTTLKNISTYMRKDPKARLVLKNHANAFEKRLEHIKFSDLENVIEIKDEIVTIPRMLIKCTALDIKLSGSHTFSNMVDYRFNFRFLDLKEKIAENEFGIIKDDGTGLKVYLRLFGDIDNPQYELDKDQMKADFKENLKEEKHTVKSLLKEEFGLFKKDTTLKSTSKQRDDVEFLLEWDTPEEKKAEIQTTEEKKNESKRKLDKLKKKLGIVEKKAEVETEIEIDENP